MGDSVPVRCPECLSTQAYAAPAFPCACGNPVAPTVAAGAVAEPLTRRSWTDEWVTVRCGACGREDDWPHPELGCHCGAVLRVPVRMGPAGGGGDAGGSGGSTESGAPGAPGAGSVAGGPDVSGAPGAGPYPDAVPHRAAGPDAKSGTGASGPDASSRTGDSRAGGPRADDRHGIDGAGTHGPDTDPDIAGPHGPDTDTAPNPTTPHGPEGPPPQEPYREFAERYPAHIPLPPTGPRPVPGRGIFRPVTIRTGRDAVAAAAGYLRWLGFRDVVQPEERPASGVDLRAAGLVAQVDPSTRPTGLRAVECLWLNGLSTSAVSAFFSLAGYTPEARTRAAEVGLPLFVLDLTGTPQPVNRAADDLAAGGA
ncbi:hypothetical protein [Streptomyces sp. S1]|uniref:hypothetical protein n=1 Tax=Streptomyces sp. S1 TaxID=718288 RepID=UPI0027D340C2|nr:hypothetical protein [Streptomyces sp. S1]